jgi:hypothetical protein
MNVTGDKSLLEDCGELDDAIATIKATGLDPEHFDIDVHEMPPIAELRASAIRSCTDTLVRYALAHISTPRGGSRRKGKKVRKVTWRLEVELREFAHRCDPAARLRVSNHSHC